MHQLFTLLFLTLIGAAELGNAIQARAGGPSSPNVQRQVRAGGPSSPDVERTNRQLVDEARAFRQGFVFEPRPLNVEGLQARQRVGRSHSDSPRRERRIQVINASGNGGNGRKVGF